MLSILPYLTHIVNKLNNYDLKIENKYQKYLHIILFQNNMHILFLCQNYL